MCPKRDTLTMNIPYLRTKANSFHEKKCEPPNSKAYSCKNKFVQHMEDGYLKA